MTIVIGTFLDSCIALQKPKTNEEGIPIYIYYIAGILLER